jgi:hypothetical protein
MFGLEGTGGQGGRAVRRRRIRRALEGDTVWMVRRREGRLLKGWDLNV